MAEEVGFEPTRHLICLSDFESDAFDLSAIPPQNYLLIESKENHKLITLLLIITVFFFYVKSI